MRGLLGRGKEFYVPRYNIPLEDSVRALRAAGGVPVVAHIFKYRFDDAQRTAMLAAAADAGALGVEVRYTTYTPEQAAAAQALAARFGLAPSGGSDYHGLRKGCACRMRTSPGSKPLPGTNVCDTRTKSSQILKFFRRWFLEDPSAPL